MIMTPEEELDQKTWISAPCSTTYRLHDLGLVFYILDPLVGHPSKKMGIFCGLSEQHWRRRWDCQNGQTGRRDTREHKQGEQWGKTGDTVRCTCKTQRLREVGSNGSGRRLWV